MALENFIVTIPGQEDLDPKKQYSMIRGLAALIERVEEKLDLIEVLEGRPIELKSVHLSGQNYINNISISYEFEGKREESSYSLENFYRLPESN